jgi:monomeric sarcosine oxidase
MSNWDVIVIGLGGVGSAAAFHLAAAGCRVLGLDQHAPAHAFGSSHGQTRIIRQAYFEHPSYVPLLRRAYELWNELEDRTGQNLFQRTGLVELGPADGVVIPGVLRAAAEHDLAIEELSAADVSLRWPGLVGNDQWRAVIEQNAGYLRVEACVKAHLQCAANASATLRHGEPVTQWLIDGCGVAVTTAAGVERASRLVIAGGPWSGAILKQPGFPLRLLRKQQYWYSPQRPGYRESDGFPCFFCETPSGHFYGFPSINDAGVKVARHSGGPVIDATSRDHPPDPEDRKLVEDFLRAHLPGVGHRLLSRAGCYYTMTPDEHFIVDTHPSHDQVTVIAGLSGHGFKFTGVLGEIACQIATGRPASYDTELLGLGRLG